MSDSPQFPEADKWFDRYTLAVIENTRLRDRIALLEAVAEAAKKYMSCEAEFYPEYPGACQEWGDHLDKALAALEKTDG